MTEIYSFVQANGQLRRGAVGSIVRLVQMALNKTGRVLETDGDFGPVTEAAIKDFQFEKHLNPVGFIGPKTSAALDEVLASKTAVDVVPRAADTPPWHAVMRAMIGTKEHYGSRHNPRIVGMAAEIISLYPDLKPNLAWYVKDETPWCGLQNAYTLARAGYKPALAPLWALNNGDQWVKEGNGIKLAGPAIGSIVTMIRSGGGHVTQYAGEDDNYWFGIGGNQSDSVNIAKFPKSREIKGHFWPKEAPLPIVGPVRMSYASAVEGSEA